MENIGLLVTQDRTKAVITVIEKPVEKELAFLYKKIGCKNVDVVRGDCHGLKFDIWLDDEGLFASGSPVWELKGMQIAGKLIIVKGSDDVGRTTWFNEEEKEEVIESLKEIKYIGYVK